jgi:hypothetical protein
VHVRRALLLFALVLGVAALATAVSQPSRERPAERPQPPAGSPTVTPNESPEMGAKSAPIDFPASDRPVRRRLAVGRSATVNVEVEEPGQVELRGLGLTAYAEPLTPARFEVLSSEPVRAEVRLLPAGATSPRRLGTLVIVPAER